MRRIHLRAAGLGRVERPTVVDPAEHRALLAARNDCGGNGTTTFALPDMRARVLIHAGQGPGLSSRVQGEAGGAEQVTLTNGTTLYAPGPGTVAMTPLLTSPAGSNAPVRVVQPFVTVKCFIALFGVFPSRP